MAGPAAGAVITPNGAPDPLSLELVTEELATHRQQLAVLAEGHAELRAGLDRDGDGQPDPPGAPPGWRALAALAAQGAILTLTAGRMAGAVTVYLEGGVELRAELGPIAIEAITTAGAQGLGAVVLIALVHLGAEWLVLRLLAALRPGGG